jgi:FkbM family methyltransferase
MNNMAIFSSPLVLVDCGASYFLPDTWQIAAMIPSTTLVLLDPNGGNLNYASRLRCKSLLIDKAVAQHSGRRLLYVSNTDSGSSLYPPIGRISELDPVSSYFFPMKIMTIKVSTLEEELNAVQIASPHVIKLDTQGSELEILKGLDERRLDSVQLIEMEVTLQNPPIYEGCTRLKDVLEFLEPKGFEIVNLRVSRHGKNSKYDLAVPGEADVLFYKRPSFDLEIVERRKNHLVSLALLNLYYLYGYADSLITNCERIGLFNSNEISLILESQAQLRSFQSNLLDKGALSLWHRDSA